MDGSEAGAQLCQFNRKRQELSMQDKEILIRRAGRGGMEGVVAEAGYLSMQASTIRKIFFFSIKGTYKLQ